MRGLQPAILPCGKIVHCWGLGLVLRWTLDSLASSSLQYPLICRHIKNQWTWGTLEWKRPTKQQYTHALGTITHHQQIGLAVRHSSAWFFLQCAPCPLCLVLISPWKHKGNPQLESMTVSDNLSQSVVCVTARKSATFTDVKVIKPSVFS